MLVHVHSLILLGLNPLDDNVYPKKGVSVKKTVNDNSLDFIRMPLHNSSKSIPYDLGSLVKTF
ncbi:hypothetical protein MTBBW1_300015 [Desulfamplus magnetovallimortis]|uniref:Uncharacterized protein n=1 Tax=Desulfamplus magnetovallimortis TaxID=1246637 RepID=A0A1W1HFM3_9BACT|nr:hypothetical protein MTBBW1_300015 [Desulfamplus magnetovallimortis]